MKLLLCRDDDNVDVLMGRGMWVVVVRAIHDDDDDDISMMTVMMMMMMIQFQISDRIFR